MRLNPREQEKLLLHVAAELAKDRRARGIKLNYAEATALITSEICEMAREGKEVAELMQSGKHIVKASECMEGVADMIHYVQVECTFTDGTKLVTVHEPIQ